MKVYVEAARPRTLSAGIAPVLVGTAAAERFIAWRFVAALIVGISLQVAVNYANDLFDALRGVDRRDRVGPRRAVASGVVTPRRMIAALSLAIGVAGAAGLALAIAVSPWLLVVGFACFVALLGYSGGPRPYASIGLGEVFVFVFFGFVATVGSAFVQDERFQAVAMVAALPVGLVAVAILVVNNLRDIPTDAAASKFTLAVRLGDRRTRVLYESLLAGAGISIVVVARADASAWPLLAWIAAPLAIASVRPVRDAAGAGLVPALGATGRLQLAGAALLALGLWIS